MGTRPGHCSIVPTATRVLSVCRPLSYMVLCYWTRFRIPKKHFNLTAQIVFKNSLSWPNKLVFSRSRLFKTRGNNSLFNFQKEEALIKEKEVKLQQHQTYLRVSDITLLLYRPCNMERNSL